MENGAKTECYPLDFGISKLRKIIKTSQTPKETCNDETKFNPNFLIMLFLEIKTFHNSEN